MNYYQNFCTCEIPPHTCNSRYHRCIRLKFNTKICYCEYCKKNKIPQSLFYKPLQFNDDISKIQHMPEPKKVQESVVDKFKKYINHGNFLKNTINISYYDYPYYDE